MNSDPTHRTPEQQDELRTWLIVAGTIVGAMCCTALCSIALMGYGAVVIGQQINTAAAPPRATLAALMVETTATAAAQATLQAQFQATATEYAQWPIVVSSTFDHNTEDWPAGTYDDTVYGHILRQMDGGRYEWEIQATKGVVWYAYPKTKTVTDFYLSVEVEQTTEAGYSCGVIFRLTPSGNYYYFGISHRFQTFFFHLQQNGTWHTLLGHTYSPVIQRDQPNVLTIIGSGPVFTFLINGQYIADFTDASLSVGRAGLAVEANAGDNASFEFDNFEVRAPPIDAALALTATVASERVERYLQAPMVFYETFNSNKHDWTTGRDATSYADGELSIDDGKYQWTYEAREGFIRYMFPNIGPQYDFYYSAELQQVDGLDDAIGGIVYRRLNNDNYYFFGITNQRDWFVRARYTGEWHSLLEESNVSAVRQGEVNVIAVLAEGSHFDFFINGQNVGSIDDKSMSYGLIGLGIDLRKAGDKAEFEFDNLAIRVPAAAATQTAGAKPSGTRTPTLTPTRSPSPTPTPVSHDLASLSSL